MDLEHLLEKLDYHNPEEIENTQKAYLLAKKAHEGQKRKTGKPYIVHPLTVAYYLAELKLPNNVIIAGLLHDVVEDTIYDLKYVREQFGERVANMVDGVTKLDKIERRDAPDLPTTPSKEALQAANLRKMVMAMIDDLGVIFIKFADRRHNLETLWPLPDEKRQRVAQETLDVFVPIAERLGFWQMRHRLQDLAFRNLKPVEYREIASQIKRRRVANERYLLQVVNMIKAELEEAGIPATVYSRMKSVYSTYKKMQRKNVDLDKIYDVRAIRIIIGDPDAGIDNVTEEEDKREISQCYATLGIVHNEWNPIPGEFDDFIAVPKDNSYRSLHTAIKGPRDKIVEIQIRTRKMHRNAEYGVAAHWRYKEHLDLKVDEAFEGKVSRLRQAVENIANGSLRAQDFASSILEEFKGNNIYVFTPQGEIVELASGATPVDFAYRIHTSVGHRCRGARVNGKLVALNQPLQTGDKVEILTSKREEPRRDWLNSSLGYATTERAKQKIRQWLRKRDREESLKRGSDALEDALRKLSLKIEDVEWLPRVMHQRSMEDVLLELGRGGISTQEIQTAILERERKDEEQEKEKAPELSLPSTVATGLSIRGVNGLLTHLARCCNPLPGTPIVGYVTQGRGITIHRQDCPNITRLAPERLIMEVDWAQAADSSYPVPLMIKAFDRTAMLSDITGAISREKINISEIQASANGRDASIIYVTLLVNSAKQLARIINVLANLSGVFEIQRRLG